MICENNESPLQKSCEKDYQSDEFISLELAISEIELLPSLDQEAQQVLFEKIVRLCTQNPDFQLKSCQNSLLYKIIQLLNFHKNFPIQLIEKIFKAIEILGKRSINHLELKALIELLQPKERFPYGLQILGCFVQWAKATSSIEFHNQFLNTNEQNQIDIEKLRELNISDRFNSRNQQAKHFFDFWQKNSGIVVESIKKWPGYGFTFYCWIKLGNKIFSKRRQLYSFYNDYGQGFEAFFTPDCSCLVIGVCNKKEFTSVQIRDVDFDSFSDKNFDKWHSIAIVHAPAKGPFSYNQLFVYIDGVLKKETNFKLPNFNDLSNIRICGSCYRPVNQSSSFLAPSLTAPLTNLKNAFGFSSKNSEKLLNLASVPAGSQDLIWGASTCLTGKMSSCFVLHDVLTEVQARLLHSIGPNQYAINWIDLIELSDLKTKLLFHYDAKCVNDSICLDLSSNRIFASFSGSIINCNNFKESLNSIGSVHIFYPLLNYLSSNQDYIELVLNEWINNSKKLKSFENAQNYENLDENKIIARRSLFDDSELEQNVASLILNFMRYLIRDSNIFQDRFERNNGLSLLGFLLQKLPRKFIDINFLHICQEYVSEAKKIANKSLLNLIYDNLIFDFRIWNKSEYEIRIGHVQYLSTVIKDDKKYFRKKYGIQFFLDIIKTYFGGNKSQGNSQTEINGNFLTESNQAIVNTIDEKDLRNLRNSLFGLIKYYAQKDIRIGELNSMISFISVTKSYILQAELLDVLIALLEAPNSSDQLYLLLFEPNMADGLYSLFVQIDLNELTQIKLFKVLRILLKSKKVYEKNKSRIRLDDCGTYAGLISKMTSELSHYYLYTNCFNSNLPLEFLKNFLLEENTIQNFDNLWHILSMFVFNPVQMISDVELLIKIRIEACEEILKYLSSNPNSIQYFTHTPAWQDIICQFLCFKRKQETNTGNNLPPIVVSSTSKLNRSNDEMTNSNNETTDWENMEITNANEKKDEVLTSTPSQTQKKNSTKETTNLNRYKMKKMINSNDEYDCSKIDKEDSIYFSSPDFNSTSSNNESKKYQFEKNQQIDELYEKVLYLINKLIWESIQGSSVDDWKERFQIFSMIYRLSKDFTFIKPIETIVLRLLESSLKHCITEIKKSAPGKEHTLAIENSRELVKLIDYFVLQSKFSLSETLISKTIFVLDQTNAFDSRAFSFMTMSTFSSLTQSSYNNTSLDESKPMISDNSQSISSPSVVSSGLGSYGIIHDDSAETSYLGMNILINALSSYNIEICAQVSAKINTIIHSKSALGVEEACYIIASVDKVISECILNNDDQHYAFLIPILKSLIDKSHNLLQMTVHVPNIPCSTISPTFYEDFKEFCKTDEWRCFVSNKVMPLKEQYLAMTVTPCQMNMEIMWNSCYESSMMSIHKRNRILGESKIKFEDTIFNKWKQRKNEETLRYNNYLLELKRNNLSMRKQLHIELKYLTSEIGPWNEGVRKEHWMLSNHENRLRMRCKLVENLNFDSHFEASRLRDFSRSDHSMYTVVASKSENEARQCQDKPSQNIPISKEAINSQINEDIVADEEFYIENKNQQVQDGSKITRKSSVISIQANQLKPVAQEHYNEYPQLEEKEKIIIRSECEMITVTKVIKGRFELTNKYIYFFDTFSPFYYLEDAGGYDFSYHDYYNSYNNNSLSGYSCHDFDILNDVKIPLVQLKEVQLRRYNLRRSALEFFSINESSYLINFNKTIRNKIYSKIVSMRLPYLQSNSSFRTPSDLLKASDYTQRWINHDMSNFEYLMKLNSIAGRSYNDLSQYPIFPWILKDFSSESIDLKDESIYRDLRKPIGVQNKKFEDYVREKYELFEDPTGAMQPFHYGTHYSNSANVMHYLIRLEPFTTLHIQLQSDRFDVADRQFYSIPSSWKILYENPADAKELIPEFFYLPEFLVNMNNFDFGQLQSNRDKVDDVALPKWAKSPEHFIYLHRKALESEYVSSHLHEWIDLIFGFKQQGVEAEKALNVFMYYSYEGAIDVDAITDPVARNATEGMISNFGQIPIQLLKEPHPKRKSLEQSIKDKINQGKPIVLWNQIKNLKAYYVEFCDIKRDEIIDPVIFINIPRNQIKSFIQQGLSEPLITICESGAFGVNGWQAYERSTANLFSFEKDPSLLSNRTKKLVSNQFHPGYELNSRVFVLTNDSKLLISGAHWDNSLRVFSLSKNRNVAHFFQHSDIVISLAIDYTSSFVVSGSKDCLCIVWRVVQEYGNCVNLEPSPFHIFFGHTDWVTAVDISNELDLVISGSKDGTVNIHSLQSGCYVKTLNFNNDHISYFNNINIKLNNERQVLIFTDGIALQSTRKHIYEIFVYSINGQLISQERLNFPVEDMIFQDKYCILGVTINQKNKTNANSSLSSSNFEESLDSKKTSESMSKIIIKDFFDLKTIHAIRLKAAITCMNLTRDESHLLVGLKDGKLIVITGDRTIK